MERYEKYKDSGIAWIGEIPEHWTIKNLKYIANNLISGPFGSSLKKEAYVNAGYKIYGQEQVIKNDINFGDYFITEEKYNEMIRYQVNADDILISCVGTFGKILLVPEHFQKGIINPRLIKISPLKNFIDPIYFNILLKSPISFCQFDLLSRGGTMEIINLDILKQLDFVIPPLEEQKVIASFLDHKTAEIDRLISQKEKLIALYEEEKTAMINQAVTRGIDRAVKLKPSGIDWLGDIPEHWKHIRIRYYSEFITSGSRGWSQYFSNFGHIFLRITNVSRDGIQLNLQDIKRVALPPNTEGERAKVLPGDIIISITADLGSVSIIPDDFEEAYVSQHLALVRPSHSKMSSQWIAYQIGSNIGKKQLLSSGYGGTKIQLNLTDIKDLWVTLPPLEEQKTIIAYIEKESDRINTKIAKTKRIIELQKEYRTALISEAVTGKIKVFQND